MHTRIDISEDDLEILNFYDESSLTEEEPLISPEDAYYRKITRDNLATPYHIRGDLTEDVLTDGGKALGDFDEESIFDTLDDITS